MLTAFNVRYFAASTDTPETNREFAEALELSLPGPEAIPTRAWRGRCGVLGVAGFPSRWTFYIGKDGRILDIDKNVQPSSHGADVARKLGTTWNTAGLTPQSNYHDDFARPLSHATAKASGSLPSVLAHVGEIPLTERELIAAIAREDEDARVRKAAVAKLMDPAALGAIAQADADETVRDEAAVMLRDIALESFEGVAEQDSLDAVGRAHRRPGAVADRQGCRARDRRAARAVAHQRSARARIDCASCRVGGGPAERIQTRARNACGDSGGRAQRRIQGYGPCRRSSS